MEGSSVGLVLVDAFEQMSQINCEDLL
jgi:hypothetical protein